MLFVNVSHFSFFVFYFIFMLLFYVLAPKKMSAEAVPMGGKVMSFLNNGPDTWKTGDTLAFFLPPYIKGGPKVQPIIKLATDASHDSEILGVSKCEYEVLPGCEGQIELRAALPPPQNSSSSSPFSTLAVYESAWRRPGLKWDEVTDEVVADIATGQDPALRLVTSGAPSEFDENAYGPFEVPPPHMYPYIPQSAPVHTASQMRVGADGKMEIPVDPYRYGGRPKSLPPPPPPPQNEEKGDDDDDDDGPELDLGPMPIDWSDVEFNDDAAWAALPKVELPHEPSCYACASRLDGDAIPWVPERPVVVQSMPPPRPEHWELCFGKPELQPLRDDPEQARRFEAEYKRLVDAGGGYELGEMIPFTRAPRPPLESLQKKMFGGIEVFSCVNRLPKQSYGLAPSRPISPGEAAQSEIQQRQRNRDIRPPLSRSRERRLRRCIHTIRAHDRRNRIRVMRIKAATPRLPTVVVEGLLTPAAVVAMD
jgi:hypothetical protein